VAEEAGIEPGGREAEGEKAMNEAHAGSENLFKFQTTLKAITQILHISL
jgi:hypothetical protein